MKYAFTTFALILTLVGGFIFGAYYMYNKYNPKAVEETAAAASTEESVDDSTYYDANGNWIFKYNEDESGYGGNSTTVSAGGQAAENIDYRITGTNFVYEDDGVYSGFHAVVTVENIGSNNLYLGKNSVFNIEDRNLSVVDSYNYVRSVPDVIAPGEKGYFYVPYGQIKTREDSVTIDEGQLSGEVLNGENDATQEGSISSNDSSNSVDIDELEKALGIGGSDEAPAEESDDSTDGKSESSSEDNSASKDISASIQKVTAPHIMAESGSSSDSGVAVGLDDVDNSAVDNKSVSADSASSDSSEDKSGDSNEGTTLENADGEADASSSDSAENDAADSEKSSEAAKNGASNAETAETTEEKTEYPGLSLYRVNEYFIMPVLDVQKCSNDPKEDFIIGNIVYGSNAQGYFTLSADVTNDSEANVDYVPVTVVALDRRGNAIAVGKDSITDFYAGAKKSFGVSYVLTKEQRSNIVQCVIYAREVVNK